MIFASVTHQRNLEVLSVGSIYVLGRTPAALILPSAAHHFPQAPWAPEAKLKDP